MKNINSLIKKILVEADNIKESMVLTENVEITENLQYHLDNKIPLFNNVFRSHSDAFFDFNKSALKAEGRAKLDDLVGKIKGISLEVIIAVGHTDSVGSDAYNQKLSVKRAEAVKAYLVTKGIEKNRVYTEGKGEKQPVADNKTAEGRAKNRRVEIEVVGTRPN